MSKFVPSIGEVALEEFKGETGIKAMVEAVMESCNYSWGDSKCTIHAYRT